MSGYTYLGRRNLAALVYVPFLCRDSRIISTMFVSHSHCQTLELALSHKVRTDIIHVCWMCSKCWINLSLYPPLYIKTIHKAVDMIFRKEINANFNQTTLVRSMYWGIKNLRPTINVFYIFQDHYVLWRLENTTDHCTVLFIYIILIVYNSTTDDCYSTMISNNLKLFLLW